MISELQQVLEQVAKRFRHRRLYSILAVGDLILALLCAAYLAWPTLRNQGEIFGLFVPAWVGSFLLFNLCCGAFVLRARSDSRRVARSIEAQYPDLNAGLLTAVDQVDGRERRKLGYLESSVVREAVEHSRSHDWSEAVPTWTLRLAQAAFAIALLMDVSAAMALRSQIQRTAGDRARSGGIAQSGPMEIKVDPGNAEIEKGSPLLVVARFDGAVPPEASLVLGDGKANPGSEPTRSMTRSLEDPTFAARVESVDADLAYRVEFAGRSSDTYQIKVFEYPALRRADARLVYPQYTSLDEKVVEDIRHITLVEGTELTLIGHLNKPVREAKLVDPDGTAIELKPNPEAGANIHQASLRPTESKRYKVQLVDLDGRSNKQNYEIAVHVTRNKEPIVKTIQPSHDVRVSPVEELALKAQMEDDFGIVKQGLSYSIGGAEPREIELKGEEVVEKKASPKDQPAAQAEKAKSPPKNRRMKAEHLLDFEALKAVPDQLVTYFFWAEDNGPDGKPRRTSGDMFFAEVRHFEEIFRQGEQPSGSAEMEMQGEGQGQNAQQSDKLAELQKEIINGTWKLIRRETGAKPTDTYAADSKVLQEAQKSAIGQAGELGGRLRDEKSKASLELAVKSMTEAEQQLTEAARGTSTTALRPALVAEQAAYQALLKLRAREFEVIRGNRQRGQRGGGGGGGASQRQLQQLELNDEQNNYEEQRSARSPQENLTKQQQEQRESRQVLSRLRELAQRQEDVNNRLKELQSALEAAREPQAKAELERQLKRLREQQQEILRDTDELRERMENEQNRDRMAEARKEIEEGREHVRQAAEALENGSVPQAVTEGARAGQKLNELKEELRKETANQFSEQVTEMRNQARQLDEKQQKLTEQLEAQDKAAPAQRSLRGSDDRKQTRNELEQQGKQLDQILDRMQETVTEAEETEPLLARELFDTIRKANEQMVPEAIRETDRLVDLGIAEEAAKSSRRAGEGLDELRQGVERAARSVLGDDTAALRRAQQELKDLADQVDREIAQGTGRPQPGDQSPRQQRQRRQRSERGEADPGQGQEPGQEGQSPQQPGQEPGQQQPGQPGQEGQGQGQRQPGQNEPNGQGRQPGQGQEPGQQGEQGQEPGQGQQPGQGQEGGQPGEGGRGQDQPQGQGGNRQRGGGSLRDGGGLRDLRREDGGGQETALDRFAEGLDRGGLPGWGAANGPITGEGFREWADRMRDVEELLEDAELRAEAARIRDRVRGTREDYRRHSKVPDWSKLQNMVAEPLNELRKRIAEEVRRRESPDSLVPIDRDPVPPQFAEGVRRYYERLGSGQ